MEATTHAPHNGGLLRLQQVDKRFQMGEVTVDALKDVSLEVYPGEMLVMVGRLLVPPAYGGGRGPSSLSGPCVPP